MTSYAGSEPREEKNQPMKEERPPRIVFVKLQCEPEARRIPATHAVEEFGGRVLVVYDGKKVVARFNEGIENWWTEEP
jgi:hypothetical protein